MAGARAREEGEEGGTGGGAGRLCGLNTFGWRFEPHLGADRNYLNLACLLARNSRCSDGHMACVLVRGADRGEEAEVVHCATNTSMFEDKLTSDIHAEANAVAAAARLGIALADTSIYVTMPPCKNCYKLIFSAGIRRIVTRRDCLSPESANHMIKEGIEFIKLEETAEVLETLTAMSLPHINQASIAEERAKRKLIKAAIKEKSLFKKKRMIEGDNDGKK